MAKTAQRKIKCPRCDRTFSMPAHLARPLNTTHGSNAKKKVSKKKAGKRQVRRVQKANRAGRPAGITTRHGLRNMTLEQLTELITAASAEAQRRITELREAIQ